MSSVDPGWGPPDPSLRFAPDLPGPPDPPRHRPFRAAYPIAVIMVLVITAALAVPAGIAYQLLRPGAPSPVVLPDPDGGRPGVGDPYFPDAGSSGYDAIKYAIDLDFDPGSGQLTGRTVITARATQPLPSFYVDLALPVTAVRVDGEPAAFGKAGFQDVKITPARAVEAGREFRVEVEYGGDPGKIRRGDVSAWWVTGQEWTAAGEPDSSAWWFPANDHPSDVALMDVSVRVPAGLQVISIGRLESRDTADEEDHDTWRWISRQPMATYLNFISIGRYEIQEGVAAGRPYLYAVSEQLSEQQRRTAFARLNRSAELIAMMEQAFGPYPFSEFGGVVPAHDFWFGGLETQPRPIYQRGSILDADYGPELIMHELAHMWYGNNVTVAEWNDIFLNEAYASWAQWLYRERTGRRTANESFTDLYTRTRRNRDFWRVTMIDPGASDLFSTVYARGPMALQALRNVLGDDAFFGLARDWAASPGPRTVEQWMAAAQARTATDLEPFFDTWIRSESVPEPTPENGFP